jgi:hypothetical protein
VIRIVRERVGAARGRNLLLKIRCKKQREQRAGRGAGAKDMGRLGGLGFRHHVEADDEAFKLGLRRRVAAHDQRIVAGDDVPRARRTKARERVSLALSADESSVR